MAHTPGPWKWEYKHVYWVLTGPNGEEIVDDGSAGDEYRPLIAGDDPNARLIAAAPDLLAAYEAYAAWHDAPAEQRWGAERLRQLLVIREQMRAAIAKAKGDAE